MYLHYIVLPEVIDITVEDPAEDFQRIRDYVDAKNCETLPAFQPAKLLQGYVKQNTITVNEYVLQPIPSVNTVNIT